MPAALRSLVARYITLTAARAETHTTFPQTETLIIILVVQLKMLPEFMRIMLIRIVSFESLSTHINGKKKKRTTDGLKGEMKTLLISTNCYNIFDEFGCCIQTLPITCRRPKNVIASLHRWDTLYITCSLMR